MSITRKIRRAQEKKQNKEDKRLTRRLQLSNFTYEANDRNMTFSVLGHQLVDFMRVLGLPGFLQEYLRIDKGKSSRNLNKLLNVNRSRWIQDNITQDNIILDK